MVCRRLLALVLALPSACTEPNPNAGDEGGSDAATSAATSATTSNTTGDDVATSASTSDTAGPSTSAADDATTASGACPIGTHLCVPAPPDGWAGPVAVVDDAPRDPDPGCAEPYALPQAVGFDDLDAPEAECDCQCSAPAGASCTNLQLVRDNSAGCGSPTATWQLDSQLCDAAPEGTGMQYWEATTGGLNAGNCTEQPTVEYPPTSFGGRHTICGAPETAAGQCDGDDVCSPIPIAPFAGQLCIWQEGDSMCPTDVGYDTRRLLYGDVQDDRGCSTCTCDLEGECTGVVYLFGADGCDGDLAAGTAVFDGACVQVASSVVEVDVSNFAVDASCNPSGGEALGAAFGKDPLTLCCRE